MSLNVYLITNIPITKKGTGVFVRKNGSNVELTSDEVREQFPNAVIEEQEYETAIVFKRNITHNLNKMAEAAGIYEALWRPHRLKEGYDIPEDDYEAEWEFEDNQTTVASEIIELLEKGLADLKARPEHFKKFNSPDGWGMYEHFVPFVESYLQACRMFPDAIIDVSR